MARKRKKSRSKKKRQRKADSAAAAEPTESSAPADDPASSGEPAATDETLPDEEITATGLDSSAPEGTESPPPEDDDFDVIALDDDEPAVASLDDDEPVVTSLDDDEPLVISLDDDDEDADRLLAETLALVEAESSGATEEQADPDSVGDVEGQPAGDAASDDDEEVDGTSETDAPVDEEATGGQLRPAITPDAIAALRQMQVDGLIDLPSDLVIDLGEATTEEERDRLLSALLSHVEMQEARYRVPIETGRRRRWKGTIASAAVTLAILMAVAPPGILVPDPPVRVTESDRTYGVLVALLLQAQQIDAFRVREQRLPNDLSEVGATLHDIRFVKSGNRLYQLVAYTTDGIAVVYDSAAPAAIFRTVAENWITTEASP